MKNNKKLIIIIVCSVIALTSILCLTPAIAKYIRTRYYDIGFESSKFYFTVDLLGDTNTLESLKNEYELYGGDTKSITFNIQNYFDDLRINEEAIEYTIKMEIINPDGGTYNLANMTNPSSTVITSESSTISGGTKKNVTYTLNIPEGYLNNTVIKVTVDSMSPYTKTMELTFNLHNYDYLVSYYITDSSSEGSIFAELFITFNESIDVSVNEVIIDWSSINVSSNVIQVDLSNEDITPIDEGNEYFAKAKINRNIEAGEVITIYFFKSNTSIDYSLEDTEAKLIDNKYQIVIE